MRSCAVRGYRLYIDEGKEATGAGCLLALLSAAVTLGFGLALGESFLHWAARHVAWWPRRTLFVLVGVVLVVPGILLFWAGAALLKRLDIPVWREEGDEGDKEAGPGA